MFTHSLGMHLASDLKQFEARSEKCCIDQK